MCEMGKKVRKLGRGEGKGSVKKKRVKIVEKMCNDKIVQQLSEIHFFLSIFTLNSFFP